MLFYHPAAVRTATSGVTADRFDSGGCSAAVFYNTGDNFNMGPVIVCDNVSGQGTIDASAAVFVVDYSSAILFDPVTDRFDCCVVGDRLALSDGLSTTGDKRCTPLPFAGHILSAFSFHCFGGPYNFSRTVSAGGKPVVPQIIAVLCFEEILVQSESVYGKRQYGNGNQHYAKERSQILFHFG